MYSDKRYYIQINFIIYNEFIFTKQSTCVLINKMNKRIVYVFIKMLYQLLINMFVLDKLILKNDHLN